MCLGFITYPVLRRRKSRARARKPWMYIMEYFD